ncbi:plastocyanin/azurin family copper-binding protein [Hyphococcus lacteus]|uniref:Plastocyanin/azurin family copper-binding protein n=1 Tax=Hyphococcus lacteus TaxID=3143536 RepID=A0ABV3Z2A8_9PROT
MIKQRKNLRRFVKGVVGLAITIAAACGPVTAETHIVSIQGLEFVPATLDAQVGDTVVWVNEDVLVHTATADNGAWDSGTMQAGDEWSVVLEASGIVDYTCIFHPTMVGTINIE